jgi:hypothetical protein
MTVQAMQANCHKRGAIAFVVVACLWLLPEQLVAGETIVDNAGGYTLDAPSGFVQRPKPATMPPDIVHVLILDEGIVGKMPVMLLIERMRGTISHERLSEKHMPPGLHGRLFVTKWQGFDVDAFELPEEVNGAKWLTYNVQIPLRREAIQVKLGGPAERKAEMLKWLDQTLDGLHGESNWLKSAIPKVDSISSETYGTILLVIAGVLVVGGAVAFWYISKKTPKGTLLAIAAALWLVSWSSSDVCIREVVVMTGAVRLLATIGIALGIVDLLRTRRPCQQAVIAEAGSPSPESEHPLTEEKE